MDIHTLEGLTRVLQASISPVALVSGVGLLILSQTNRFSRIADRLRDLAGQRGRSETVDPRLEVQVRIFHRRARILRLAIAAAVASVLLASVLVLFLFTMAVLDLHVAFVGLALFSVSLVSLIISLALFLMDMSLSLEALEAELKH